MNQYMSKHWSEQYILFQSFLVSKIPFQAFHLSLLLKNKLVWEEWNLGRTDKNFSFQCLKTLGISGATRPLLPKAFPGLGLRASARKACRRAATGCFLLPPCLRLGFPHTVFSDLLSHHTFGSCFCRLHERQTCLCGNVWFLLQSALFRRLSGEDIQSHINNGAPNCKTPSVNTVMRL